MDDLSSKVDVDTYDLDSYQEILLWAQSQGVRVIGVNAPEAMLHLVLEVGLDALPNDLKDVLPELDLANPEHRQRFDRLVGHMTSSFAPVDPTAKERMYQCQVLWEEYMAESVNMYLRSPGAAEHLVCLTGLHHIIDRVGVPDRVQRRAKTRPFTVVPLSVDWTVHGTPVIDHPLDRQFSDWIWLTPPELEASPADWV